MASYRPRRLFIIILSLPVLFLFLLFFGSPASRQTISDLFSTNTHPSKLPDEIFGLLHFVTSPDEAGRVLGTVDDPTTTLENDAVQLRPPVDPQKPVDLAWYALGSIAKTGGRGRLANRGGKAESVTRGIPPRRVFKGKCPEISSYCPYSTRAKRLLELYDLSPPPKIIEVDLRVDSSRIKTLLTRLTRQPTFPNVILRGRSLGGSDDLMRLHEGDRLRRVLEAGGVTVGWTGEGDEGILP